MNIVRDDHAAEEPRETECERFTLRDTKYLKTGTGNGPAAIILFNSALENINVKMNRKQFAKFAKSKLESFTGKVIVHSPVSIERTIADVTARYEIQFENGRAFKDHRGKRICFGEMQLGVMMLFRCGRGNECRRHLLFPDTLLMEDKVLSQIMAGVPSAEIVWRRDSSFDNKYAGLFPCRFHDFRAAILLAGLNMIRYEVVPVKGLSVSRRRNATGAK